MARLSLLGYVFKMIMRFFLPQVARLIKGGSRFW